MQTRFPAGRAEFWDSVYSTKSEDHVSWYQENPEPSLRLINSVAPDKNAAILDVGCGASRLVDALSSDQYTDVTVLDVSRIALERAKARLGARATRISWIAEDVTRWKPQRQWRVWHDRAVFHFLIDREEQDAYIEVMKQGTKKGSVVIIATFALTGPERCSGLPVQRYSASTLSARLGPDFRSEHGTAVVHATPFGTTQEFMFAVFRRE